MSASGQGLDGLDDFAGLNALWAARPRTRGAVIGTGVAFAIHLTVATLLVRVDTARLFRDTTVEMDVQEPPPPPPEVRPEPPPPPPPPEVKHVVVRRAAAAPPPEAPPPPMQEAPKAGEAPPVFGVTMSSVVGGDSAGMAVPVGNSLMTKPHKAPATAPTKPAGDPDGLAAAVPEVFIAEPARVVHEVTAPFPPEAQRMQMEGRVVAKLYIDENGDVRRVTLTEKAGHGFDELARDALKKFKFAPARTSDGKAVPTNITYTYRFEQSQQ